MPITDDACISVLTRFLDLTMRRSELVMSNMANIDTPGFKTKDVNFRQELEKASGELESASLPPAARQVRGLIERPDGNNVSLERESLLLAQSQLAFNAGVQLLRDRFKMISAAIHEGSTSTP